MNEWLAIMLEEIDRKKREAEEAQDESVRRSGRQDQAAAATDTNSDDSRT